MAKIRNLFLKGLNLVTFKGNIPFNQDGIADVKDEELAKILLELTNFYKVEEDKVEDVEEPKVEIEEEPKVEIEEPKVEIEEEPKVEIEEEPKVEPKKVSPTKKATTTTKKSTTATK